MQNYRILDFYFNFYLRSSILCTYEQKHHFMFCIFLKINNHLESKLDRSTAKFQQPHGARHEYNLLCFRLNRLVLYFTYDILNELVCAENLEF